MANDDKTDGSVPSGQAPDGKAAQSGQASGQAIQPQIGIQSQYIKDLSFESPGAPASLVSGEAPDIKVNVQVQAKPLGGDAHEVVLHIVSDAQVKGKAIFLIELTYAGVFTVLGVPEDSIQAVLLVECPRLIFPFARRVVADVSRDGGFPPLMISPIDFVALYRQQVAQRAPEQATAGQQAQAAPADG